MSTRWRLLSYLIKFSPTPRGGANAYIDTQKSRQNMARTPSIVMFDVTEPVLTSIWSDHPSTHPWIIDISSWPHFRNKSLNSSAISFHSASRNSNTRVSAPDMTRASCG